MVSASSGRSRQLVFLFWALPAFVAAYGMHIVSVAYNPGLTFIEKLGAQLLMWMSWGIWSLLIFAILDRFAAAGAHWSRVLLALVPLCALVVVAQILLAAGVTRLYALGPGFALTSTIAVGMRVSGAVYVVTFWAIVGTHAGVRWYEAWRTQSLLAERLKADLTAAQLRALKAQLNPHFLFNALNSVVTLIAKEPASAERMVVRLSDLLRGTLALSSEQEVSLKRELELASQYLDIEQIRFQDRLVVTWEVDPLARDAAVPALALQPLIENAIVHGTSRITGCGKIVVSAAVDGTVLEITVRDNGYGPSAAGAKPGTGIGLANLRERLSRLYGDAASLTLVDAEGGGALATLTLPFRAAAA
jgi:signal transduction histidine kinase